MIFIDDVRLTYGKTKICHAVAETTDELLAVANAIDVEPHHIKGEGTRYEFLVVPWDKRKEVLKHNATEVTIRGLIAAMLSKPKE